MRCLSKCSDDNIDLTEVEEGDTLFHHSVPIGHHLRSHQLLAAGANINLAGLNPDTTPESEDPSFSRSEPYLANPLINLQNSAQRRDGGPQMLS